MLSTVLATDVAALTTCDGLISFVIEVAVSWSTPIDASQVVRSASDFCSSSL